VIFVDSNIPMYLVGREHPNKQVAARQVERALLRGIPLVTDAEVLQEILHRYTAIHRPGDIGPAFDAITGIVDDVFPIDHEAVEAARRLIGAHHPLSARDAIHVAVMRIHGIRQVLTFDRGFDAIPGIERVPD
jgi:predicted nucleic acid-binding protein